MNVQLGTSEVQTAVAEYLRRRGMVIDDIRQVRLEIVNGSGERLSIAGCAPIVVAYDVKLPEEGAHP